MIVHVPSWVDIKLKLYQDEKSWKLETYFVQNQLEIQRSSPIVYLCINFGPFYNIL